MDGFNFAFSLFALLLGLSLAEVLSGFARALKQRQVVHLGALTPMLAILVMLDLTSFWEFGWGARHIVTPQYGVLLIGLVACGLYYLAASLVFPSEFGEGRQKMRRADFDAHYVQHRRQVVGAIFICDMIEVMPVMISRFAELPARFWLENILQYGAMLAAILTPNKRVNIVVLGIVIAVYLYSAAMSFIQPVPL
jgi:hypothetical protein